MACRAAWLLKVGVPLCVVCLWLSCHSDASPRKQRGEGKCPFSTMMEVIALLHLTTLERTVGGHRHKATSTMHDGSHFVLHYRPKRRLPFKTGLGNDPFLKATYSKVSQNRESTDDPSFLVHKMGSRGSTLPLILHSAC